MTPDQLMRKDTAKHYRAVHRLRLFKQGLSEPQLPAEEQAILPYASRFAWCLLLATLMFIASCVCSKPAHAFSDEQYVKAIFMAEGGLHAQYPYGIRSVKCSTREECRTICLRTIRNNRKRFIKNERLSNMDFISYLASRYAPLGTRNDPKNLNANWIKNVQFFLKNPRR